MEETITILRVGTEEAVRNIADLKNNIKALKEGFEDAAGKWHDGLVDLEIGTKEYQDTLEELKVNQNALKDAMYATSSSMEDVAKAATGASESYNSLVHRMAALKEEFRATNDAVRRAELGQQIKAVNDQLKDLDALQGNFQRNVGNYAGSIKDAFGDMSKNVDVFRKSLGAVGGGLNGLKDGMEGISKSPFVATFGLLVSIAIKLADELKENETAMASIKGLMNSLKPVMDFFSGIIENLAQYLADIIGEVAQFLGSSGLINKIIKGVMGVGNAILQFVIAPFKGIIAAIRVFKEQGVKGLGDAARAFGQEMKSGVAFKENFNAGQVAADTMLSGVKSRKKAASDAGKELGKEAGKSFAEKMFESAMNALKLREKWDEAILEWKKNLDDALEDSNAEMQEEIDDMFQGEVDALKKALEEEEELRKKDLENAKKIAQAKKDMMKGVASATSDILGAIADMYEADEESSEKNANKIKNLRIAAATIDTISGAIGAYMQAAATIPPPYGIITGAIQAAAVTAAGIAQIAQIKKTKVSGSSQSSSIPTSAISSAPTLTTEVSNVRSVTSASEEERLNQMAKDQRVYILADDIQASQDQIKTQVAESSF
ncbi:MAG: hypothetical protein IKY16_02675 [Bacteroidales bacterium]|nr:hypothetical protein [Bacteroidales bacterium]